MTDNFTHHCTYRTCHRQLPPDAWQQKKMKRNPFSGISFHPHDFYSMRTAPQKTKTFLCFFGNSGVCRLSTRSRPCLRRCRNTRLFLSCQLAAVSLLYYLNFYTFKCTTKFYFVFKALSSPHLIWFRFLQLDFL